MSDDKATPKKGVRTVADLKVTGRNKEGEEPLTFGESIHAVFAEHSDAGSSGSLEPTDPIVLRALKGWMELDDALAGLPTGTRDELCIKALVQALDNIDALKLQYGMRLTVANIQGLLDAAILSAKVVGEGAWSVVSQDPLGSK